MRKIALLILLVAAAGSLALVFNEGRRTPVFLLVLFLGWVLSPYFALWLASVVFKRRPAFSLMALYRLMLIISISSLVIYIVVLSQHITRPAFIFIVVP